MRLCDRDIEKLLSEQKIKIEPTPINDLGRQC